MYALSELQAFSVVPSVAFETDNQVMKSSFGADAARLKRGEYSPVEWDSDLAVNGHMLLMGMSGAGKTHQLRKLIRNMQSTRAPNQPLRVHVFDVHGDIEIEGASTVLFSEQTEWGLNPLVVNSDIHYGGIRKRIQSVISTINKTSRQLGTKQEAVLRNMLTDLYGQFGFRADDPSTWHVSATSKPEPEIIDGKLYIDVPIDEKDEAKKLGARWDGASRSWWISPTSYVGAITKWGPKTQGRRHPTMLDALRYANRVKKTVFLGSSQEAVTNLDIYNQASRAFQAKVLAATRKGERLSDDDKLQADLDKTAQRAIDAYTSYVESIKSGRELEELLKYDSYEVVKSVVERLENLTAIGIFKNHAPPFDPSASVWRYHLKNLGREEQKLFVLFRLQELFDAAVNRGETPYITDVIICDEANRFFDKDPDNILNAIASELRKFGVALVCSSQAPDHFSDDFIASVGTKVVLGLDEMFWASSVKKLRVEIEALRYVKPRERLIVQIKQSGDARNNWQWVSINAKPAPVATSRASGNSN